MKTIKKSSFEKVISNEMNVSQLDSIEDNVLSSIVCTETGSDLSRIVQRNIGTIRTIKFPEATSLEFFAVVMQGDNPASIQLDSVEVQPDEKIVSLADKIAKVASVSLSGVKNKGLGIQVRIKGSELDMRSKRVYRASGVVAMQKLFFNLITLQSVAFLGKSFDDLPEESINAIYISNMEAKEAKTMAGRVGNIAVSEVTAN